MIPAALRIPAFRRLVAGSTLSSFGSTMTYIVLPMYVWSVTGSAAAFAAMMAAEAAGTIAALPFGGVLADRLDRRRLMLVGDAIGLISVLSIIAVTRVEFWALLPLIGFVQRVCGSLVASAGPALRRDVVPDEHRAQAASLLQVGQGSASLLAPLVGVAVYVAAGIEWMLAIDAATYAISFVLIAGLRHEATRPARADKGPASPLRTFVRDLSTGVRAARRDACIGAGTAAGAFAGLGNGLLLASLIPWLERSVGASAEAFGLIVVALGASALASSLVMAKIASRVPPARLLRIGCCCTALGAMGYVGAPPMWVVAIASIAFGASNAVSAVASEVIDQLRVPSALQGRINSLQMLLFQSGFLVGSLTAGWASSIDPRLPVSAFAGTMVICAALGIRCAKLAERPVVLTAADVDDMRPLMRAGTVDADLAVSG